MRKYVSSLNMCENQKQWYVHDLLDVINNPTKFQLNWKRTNFQLNLGHCCDLEIPGH